MTQINVERLTALMKTHKLSGRRLGLKAKLGETVVSDIIVGRTTSPRYRTIEAIGDVLGCDVEYLMGRIDSFRLEVAA